MMATCTICKQLVAPDPFTYDPALLVAQEPMAYQAAMAAFARHVAIQHPEALQTLQGIAQTYLYNLLAKLALSTDPAFDRQRDEARALCYWTLNGQISPAAPAPESPGTIARA